jgi:hypothetical protein
MKIVEIARRSYPDRVPKAMEKKKKTVGNQEPTKEMQHAQPKPLKIARNHPGANLIGAASGISASHVGSAFSSAP